MARNRTVFFISDRTGITAEILGRSLLSQFAEMRFDKVTLPFIDTLEKARAAKEKINARAAADGARPLVLSTLVSPQARAIIASADARCLDLFESFIGTLEAELELESSPAVGRSHGVSSEAAYQRRIEAVNFALSHDDGAGSGDLDKADIILVGVSRSGKTPTCLYLALHYGIRAANFPLTPEDFKYGELPAAVRPHRGKLFGLSISPERLQRIREERMPGSGYAALATCREEVYRAEALFRSGNIPFLDTSSRSVEEISAAIMEQADLPRLAH